MVNKCNLIENKDFTEVLIYHVALIKARHARDVRQCKRYTLIVYKIKVELVNFKF